MPTRSSRPTPSPHSPFDSEDGRAFYQQRIALLNQVLFWLSFGFLILVSLLELVNPRVSLRDTVNATHGFHSLATLVALAVWQLTRKRPLSAGVLATLDLAGITLQVAAYAAMSIWAPDLPDTRADFAMCLTVMALQVTRAVLLPSTTLRTAAVGVVMSMPVLLVGYHVGGHVHEMYNTPRFFLVVNDALWCAVTVVVASLTSRTIYGLRRQVEEAQRVGQYTLEEKIGEGGMGTVYRARHALLRRPTAVKLLPPEKAGLHNLTRFEREVQLTSQLTHPNTVAIFDYGHTPDGIFYYAMEYLDGLDLERVVAIDGPQDSSRVVHILALVCGALVEAHGIGLVHRDIKPANVILCERGGVPDVAKVVDFGLVKQLSGSDSGLSVGPEGHAGIVGTPHYLSPESITSPDRVDARSDIYSLGALAYFLLTGTPVFGGSTLVEVCGHHLHTTPESPSTRLGRPVPEKLERLVLACLEKDPSRRPQSASEVRKRLSDCAVPQWTEEEARAWWNSALGDNQTRRRSTEHPRLLGQTFAIDFAQRA